MDKVSIIVPIFNSEKYLKNCLESIINQTCNNLEIILVNDGSTDSSQEIIIDYATKDNRIITIKKENGGIGSAYKEAFKVMSGDYVLMVDSDDWLELNAVENLLKMAIDNDADMVSFAIKAFNSLGEEVKPPAFKNIDLINITNEEILKTHFEVLKHPTLVRLYKRKLFKDVIVFEQNIGIDELLTPQLLKRCNRAVYTSKIFYNVTIRQNSICRSEFNEKKIFETLKCYQFICSFMESNIPNYSIIIYNKYLNVISGIYDFLILNNDIVYNEFYKTVRNEIKRIRKKIRIVTPASDNIIGKVRLILILCFPNLYELLLRFINKVFIKKSN